MCDKCKCGCKEECNPYLPNFMIEALKYLSGLNESGCKRYMRLDDLYDPCKLASKILPGTLARFVGMTAQGCLASEDLLTLFRRLISGDFGNTFEVRDNGIYVRNACDQLSYAPDNVPVTEMNEQDGGYLVRKTNGECGWHTFRDRFVFYGSLARVDLTLASSYAPMPGPQGSIYNLTLSQDELVRIDSRVDYDVVPTGSPTLNSKTTVLASLMIDGVMNPSDATTVFNDYSPGGSGQWITYASLTAGTHTIQPMYAMFASGNPQHVISVTRTGIIPVWTE